MNAYEKSLTYSHCENSYEEEEYGILMTKMTNDSEDNEGIDNGKDDLKPQISFSHIRTITTNRILLLRILHTD